METHKDVAEQGATTHPEGEESAEGAQWSWTTYDAMASDGNHAPQKFVGADRWIRGGEPVALREQVIGKHTQSAVDEKTALTEKEDDISPTNLRELSAADGQQVAGPKRRQHAGAGHLKTKLAETSEDFRGQVALAGLTHAGDGGGHNHVSDYECFVLNLH